MRLSAWRFKHFRARLVRAVERESAVLSLRICGTLAPLLVMDGDIALLARELECSLCRRFFEDPVSLPCAHVFCRRCVRSKLEGVGVFANECPSCKQPAYVKDLSKNTKVAAVAELVKAMGAEPSLRRDSPAPAQQRRRRSSNPPSLSGAAAKRPRGGDTGGRAPSDSGGAAGSSEPDDSQGLRDGFAAWAARQRELGTPSSGELEALEETAEDLRSALAAVESRMAERDAQHAQRRSTSQPGGSAADKRSRFARTGVTELRKMCMAVFGRVYNAQKMRGKLSAVDAEALDTAMEAFEAEDAAAAPAAAPK